MKIAVILFVGISIILSSCGNAENPYQNTSPADGASVIENAESEKGNETFGTDIKNTEKNTDSAEKDTKAEENNNDRKNQKNREEDSLSGSENQDKRKTEEKSGNQKDQEVHEEPEKQAESEENRTSEEKANQSESKGQSEPEKTEESDESSKTSESTESQKSAEQKKSSETSEPQEKPEEDSGKTSDKDKSEEKDSGNTRKSESDNEVFTDGIRTVFASGITKENFYDVNKLWDGNDTNLCWAATSSNLIVWWQDLYEKKGKTLPEKAVRDGNEIFAMFRKYKGDVSGTFLNGVPWYFIGNQSGNGGADGGFLLDLCGIEWMPLNPKAYSYYDEGKLSAQKDFSELIISGLKKGAAGLKLHNRYDHAITLWGAEYDTSRNVNAIYVTDSDDRFSGMKRYEVFFDGKNIVIKNYDTSYNKITGAMFLYAP